MSRLAWAAVVAVAATACSDASQQQLTPNVPQLAAGKAAAARSTLQRRQPLAASVSRSFTVDAAGGVLELAEAGLRITVPARAMPAGVASVTITATALAGAQYAYEFQPSGIAFARPIRIEQDIRASVGARAAGHAPIVSYFKSPKDLDPANARATTYEDLATSVDPGAQSVRADVWHFSGYIVCWGRGRSATVE